MCRMQRSGHELRATSASFNAESMAIAPQVSAVVVVTEGLQDKSRSENASSFAKLLMSLLLDARMTAAQMRKLPWVRSAQDKALQNRHIGF